MKMVYFGSDVFLSCFEYFIQNHHVLALYTYHNGEDYFTEYAITERARQLGIPVHYESITRERMAQYMTQEGCELFFVAEYDRILPLPTDLPAFRGINIHSSLLPTGRSYYPIEAAMERHLVHTGVTMHKLAQAMDEGDILSQRSIEITPDMDSVDIYLRSAAHAREMVEEIIGNIDAFWSSSRSRREKESYWHRPEGSLLTLGHHLTRREALDIFRRYNMMTQLSIHGTWYHVSALTAGVAPLAADVQFLSPSRVLYRIQDGHLRLQIHPMEVQ